MFICFVWFIFLRRLCRDINIFILVLIELKNIVWIFYLFDMFFDFIRKKKDFFCFFYCMCVKKFYISYDDDDMECKWENL